MYASTFTNRRRLIVDMWKQRSLHAFVCAELLETMLHALAAKIPLSKIVATSFNNQRHFHAAANKCLPHRRRFRDKPLLYVVRNLYIH